MAFSRTCSGQAFLAGEKVFVGTDVAAQMRERALFDSRLTSQVRTGPRAVKSQSERHIPIHEQNVNFLSLRKCNSSWPRVYFFRPAVQRAPPARKRRLLSCKTCSPRASRSGRRSRFAAPRCAASGAASFGKNRKFWQNSGNFLAQHVI